MAVLQLELDVAGFDVDNAYFLVKACQFTDLSDEKIGEKAVERLGMEAESVVPFRLDDPEEGFDFRGFFGSGEGFAVLAFRDVINMEPWLSPSAMVQKSAFGGLVHKGFLDGMEATWDLIGSDLLAVMKDKPLFVTGHGLGAALALLTAAKLDSQGTPPREVYTFGAPRVGDMEFYYNYGVRTYRMVNNNDIIAHVPAVTVPLGFQYATYKHVGTLKYFDRHHQLGEGVSSWEVKKQMIHERLLKLGQPPTTWFHDHNIDSYRETLQGYVPEDTEVQ